MRKTRRKSKKKDLNRPLEGLWDSLFRLPSRFVITSILSLLPLFMFQNCGSGFKAMESTVGSAVVPSVSISVWDVSSGSRQYTNSPTVGVTFSGGAQLTRLCISPSQATPPQPNGSCSGGLGTQNGWHSAVPGTLVLSGADGDKTLYFWWLDSSGFIQGNANPIHIFLDQTLPQINIPMALPSVTNQASFDFAFSVSEVGSGLLTTRCRLDSGAQASCANPFPFRSLASGAHSLVIEVTDAAGNVATFSGSFAVDTTAPTITFSNVPANPSSQRTGTIGFGSLDASQFQCSLDSPSNFSTCSSPFSYQNLGDGSHTLFVRATDAAGNSTTAQFTWVIDGTVLSIINASMSVPVLTNIPTAIFSFASSRPGSTFECQLDTNTRSACSNPDSRTVSSGAHTFSVWALFGGATSAPYIFNWTVDTIAPVFANPQASAPAASAASANMNLSVSDNNSINTSSVICTFNGSPVGCSATQTNVTLTLAMIPAGANSVIVSLTDAAGNPASATVTWTATPPLPPPTIAIASLTAGVVRNSTTMGQAAVFSFSGSNAVSFECRSNTTAAFTTCTSPFNFPGSGSLTPGTYTIEARSLNASGVYSLSIDSFTWTVVEPNPAPLPCSQNYVDGPASTHWSNATGGFVYGATDAPPITIGAASTYPYTYGSPNFAPDYDNYLTSNYSKSAYAREQIVTRMNALCAQTGVAFGIVNMNPTFPNLVSVRDALLQASGRVQIVHSFPMHNSIVSVILPPNWRLRPKGSYPIIAQGFYDVNDNVLAGFGEAGFISQLVGLSGTQNFTGAIGIIWNGGGSISTVATNARARADFSQIVNEIGDYFGADPNRIIMLGGSRGGTTTLTMASNPENYPYRVTFAYSWVPGVKIGTHARLIGPTMPMQLGSLCATGLQNGWHAGWTYPAGGRPSMVGLPAANAIVYQLCGTSDLNLADTDRSPISQRFIDGLARAGTQLVLAFGSHDEFIPWGTQVEYWKKLSGLPVETHIVMRAGHTADFTKITDKVTNALRSYVDPAGNVGMRTVLAGQTFFYYVDMETRAFVPFTPPDGMVPFTLEVPKKLYAGMPIHFYATGEPGTTYSAYVGGVLVTSGTIGSTYMHDVQVPVSVGPGVYTFSRVSIQKPGQAAKDLNLTLTPSHWLPLTVEILAQAPPAISCEQATTDTFRNYDMLPSMQTNWGVSEY